MPNSILKIFLALIFCFTSQIVMAQVADFTADDTVGCVPKIINFKNTSTGATSYSWNLGNGSTPTTTDASGSYTLPGTYTVTLVAKNGTSTSTKTMIVRIYAAPTVAFSASATTVCPGAPITFTSTSTPNSWGTLSNTWNFGDGGTSTSTTAVYTYTVPGFYNVNLIATNSPGCSNSLSKSSYIHVLDLPLVSYSGTPTAFCKVPTLVSFTNTSTGTAPLTYKWLFGDGGTSTLLNPTHNYVTTGSYNLSLKVKDGNGCTDSLVIPSYVNAGSLAAAFTSTTTACTNVPVSFNNTSSTHISSEWFFGDGGYSTDEFPTYTYGSPGTYPVKLKIFDGSCYDSVIHNVTILPLPNGTFSSTPVRPCAPPVNVTYNASVAGGTTVAWLFGDGTTGSGLSKVKTYNTSVIDFVDMIITNASGCKNTIERIDTIFNLYLNPSALVTNGCAPLATTFNVYAYSVVYNHFTTSYDFYPYPYPIASYDWDFRDGSPHGSGPSPSHTYTAPGIYNAKVTIVTSNGCTDTGIVTIAIGKKPVASYTMSPTHICAGRSVSFKSTTTDTVDLYMWDFGDGSMANGPTMTTAVHVYTLPGIFTTSLQVQQFGCVGPVVTKTDTVDSPNAVINLVYNCIPANEVTLKDYSLGDDTHLWQFGDLTTSTVSNVVHAYSSLASYTVTLSTYNIKSGCRDTARVIVDLRRPTMQFTGTKLQLCRDQIDTFNANVFGSATPVSMYKWLVDGFAKDSSGPRFITKFSTTGPHTISLIVTDSHGCYDTLTKTNYVLVAKPINNFSFTPTTGCGPMMVNFTDASTDVTGIALANYNWTFGDGGTNTAGGPTPSHLYVNSGVYSVKTIVTDVLGCSDTLTNSTKVTVYRPMSQFSASATSVCRNRNVHFNNTSTLATSYLWSFGDGGTSTVVAPDHIYTTSGLFTVTLVAFESHGCTDTLTKTNYINVNPSPTASFTQSDSFAVCPPLNVKFTNTSTGATSYSWAFGDGSFSVVTSPSEPYILPGAYIPRLVAKNAFACSDTAYGSVSIFGYKGAFKYTPVTGCSPLKVQFKATLGTIAYTTWDFSDGNTSGPSLSDTISHIYVTPGYYIPKLILTDTSGCSSFSIGADTIKVDTLIPDFTVLPNPVCVNNSAVFHDISTSLFSPPSTWLWTFGSGSTSTLGTVTHIFTASGTYSVTLTATNAYGCSGSVTKNILVNPTPPPITGLKTICAGNQTSLTDLITGGTWTSGNTAVATVDLTTGVVSGLFAGTSTIVYTAPTGCFVSTIVTVNKNPSIIKGNTGICFGQTSTLSDSTAAGVWSSSNTAVATIGSTSGFVTTLALGTSVITYRLLTTGCLSTATVTVATAPVTVSGNTAVCIGGTSGLSDAVPGGSWSSGNTMIATIDPASGLVSGIALGTSLITYSLGTGCSINATVTVIPIPAPITGPGNVCAGFSIPLSDPTPGGKWTSSNNTIAVVGSVSGIVTGVAGGTDTIYYTFSTGCNTSKSILVNSTAPITGGLNVCYGNTTTLSNAVTGGTWTSANPLVATIDPTSALVTGKSPGTTVISYTLPTSCVVTTTVNVISIPAAITGPTSICVGTSAFLIDATLFGTWTSDNTAIATIDPVTGLTNGIRSGTVLISYSIGTGCKAVTTIVINPNSPISGPKNVCMGQSIVLIDTSLGGAWNSGNTAIAAVGRGTGVVTGISPGTTSISYTLRTGCVQTYSVTTLALPPAITGTMNVCAGLSVKLSDALIGGTWTSSNPFSAAIGLSSGIVTGLVAGTVTITYIAGGCPITTAFTVNPLPAPIAGSNIGCFGLSTMLSDASGGGVWTSGATTVATIGSTSGIVTGAKLGTVTITYALPTGCLATKALVINPPPPPIKGTSFVCEGLTTKLSDFVLGGTWASSDTMIAKVNSGTGLVAGILAGNATITYTASGCYALQTVTINPLPPAIMGDTAVCEGSSITLSDIGGGTWTSSTPTLATIGYTSGIMNGLVAGVDTITYTLGTGCITSATITVNPVPAPITGSPYLCTTLTTSLSDITSSGVWSSSKTTIATVDAFGLVSGISPGVADISYTLATGCAAIIPVQVYPFPTAIKGPSNICQYTPVTLSDGVTGGTWTSDNTAVATIGLTSGAVTGLSLSTTTITYNIGSSCYVTTQVSVMPLPAVFAISGGGNYCSADSGQHIYLSGSVKGTNYFLYKGSSIATGPIAGTDAALDFGLQKAPGVYTILATNELTGCSLAMTGSVTISVTTSVIPDIKILPAAGDTLCNGATISMTSIVAHGGLSPLYAWYINGTKVTTGTSYSYIPKDKDVVTVRITSNAPCAEPDTASDMHVLKVIAPATPSATLSTIPGDTICSGEKMTLTADPLFGGSAPTYTWIVNTVPVGTGNPFTYVPTKDDIVYAQMTSNYPCLAVATVPSNSVAVSVVEPIVPHVVVTASPGTNIAAGTYDTLTAVAEHAGDAPTYQWVINGIPVEGATSKTFISNNFSSNKQDSVSCVVTSSGICKMTTHGWVYIYATYLGVKNISGSGDISIIPNPNKGEFTVKGSIGTLSDEEVSLEITDLLGQVVYRTSIAAKNGNINERIVLGSSLANSMYILNVRSRAETKVFHIVVER